MPTPTPTFAPVCEECLLDGFDIGVGLVVAFMSGNVVLIAENAVVQVYDTVSDEGVGLDDICSIDELIGSDYLDRHIVPLNALEFYASFVGRAVC